MRCNRKYNAAGGGEPEHPPHQQQQDEEEFFDCHDQQDNEELEEEDRPKLAEGFYEIETVRKKRIKKGKTQYLIKWRGWPETANTWEPKENLRACADIVDAFEESLKPISAKRGKRKAGVTISEPKKKKPKHQQSSPDAATDKVPIVKLKIKKGTLPMAPLDNSPSSEEAMTGLGPINGVEGSKQALHNGFGTVSSKDGNVMAGQIIGNPASELRKVEDVAQPLPGYRPGSRRRKPSSVKKFTLTSEPGETVYAQADELLLPIKGYELNRENGVDFSKGILPITEIVKPVSYGSSIVNGAADISVVFVAKRSDGKDIVVDNKFLKTNNPLLLIDFYEAHLKYNPSQ